MTSRNSVTSNGNRREIRHGLIIGLILVTSSLLIPYVGAIFAIIIGLRYHRLRLMLITMLLCCGILAYSVLLEPPCVSLYRAFVKEFEVKYRKDDIRYAEGLRKIRDGIETYYDVEDEYPPDIKTLQRKIIVLNFLPRNPYGIGPMVEIDPGETPRPGTFSYYPVIDDGEITGYFLIGYGNRFGEPDHITIICTDSNNTDAGLEILPWDTDVGVQDE